MVDDIREQLTAEYPADQLICDGTVADVSQNCASNRCAPRVKQYDACYKHKTSGEYVWGQYKNNTSYDEVNVSMSSCNRLEIKKVDSSGNVLTGATVTITGISYNKEETIGSSVIEKLSPGTYKVKETGAPMGYELDETEITITVASNGEITVADASNVYARTTTATRNARLSIENTQEEQPACYKDKITNEYIWGKYEKDDRYELISDKGQDDCYVEMLVPKTDYNINRLVLVVMSLFAIIGLGYIIYSHYLRTHK